MGLETDLKKYLPINQQRSESLNDFLDAVGELLEGFKGAIDDFQSYNDFHLAPSTLLDTMGKQFDIDFPRNMSETRKRDVLNGIVTLYRSKGTAKSLIRIFRLIGWEVEIDEAWIIDPTYFDSHASYTITNDQGGSLELFNYTKIYGHDVVYPNRRMYVDLYDSSNNQYPKRQIYGETYPYDDAVKYMKVPYIRIKVTSEDYDVFTNDYTQNGKVYSYDSSEEFAILEFIRNYFLNRARPAHVAIIEISTPFIIEDTIVYTIDDPTFTLTTQNAGLKYDGTASYGTSNDRYILGETMGGYKYGTSDITVYGVDQDSPDDSISRSYAIGTSGDQNHILIRKNSDIVVTVPSDATIKIYATEDNGLKITDNTAFWQLIETVTNQTSYTVTLTNFFAVFVKITVPSSTSAITATINIY